MSTDSDDPAKRIDPRAKIALGAVAAAVVLGGGAYAVTTHVHNRDVNATRAAAVRPPVQQIVPAPEVSVSTPVAGIAPQATAAGVPSSGSASPAASLTSSISPQVRKEIDAARAAAAEHGHPVAHPPQPKGAVVPANLVSTRTQKTSDGTIQITSAKADLAGQQSQLLAADAGHSVGDATCTQKIRFSKGAAAREIPNMILCWRTSAARSVVTLAVAKKGKASAAESVGVIDSEWSKLG